MRRPVAHDEDDLVPQILKLAELAQADDVTEVDVRRLGSKPIFRRSGVPRRSMAVNSSSEMIRLTPRRVMVDRFSGIWTWLVNAHLASVGQI